MSKHIVKINQAQLKISHSPERLETPPFELLLQCEPMDDAMKVMAEEEPELKEVKFLRVEAEKRSNISTEFHVAAVPTFLFFRSGICPIKNRSLGLCTKIYRKQTRLLTFCKISKR
jgi:hypothetical protein